MANRLLENGSRRLLESGGVRLLEPLIVAVDGAEPPFASTDFTVRAHTDTLTVRAHVSELEVDL